MDDKTPITTANCLLLVGVFCFATPSFSQGVSDQPGIQSAEELIGLYLPGDFAGNQEEITRGISVHRGIAGVRKGKRQNEAVVTSQAESPMPPAVQTQGESQSASSSSANQAGSQGGVRSNQYDFQNIVFDSGSFLIPSESYQQLDEIGLAFSTLLQRFPDMTFVIEGHTDSLGDEDQNRILSFNRATAIKRFLAARHSISSNNISAVGIGENNPIATNSTTEGRARNRRVRIISRP